MGTGEAKKVLDAWGINWGGSGTYKFLVKFFSQQYLYIRLQQKKKEW